MVQNSITISLDELKEMTLVVRHEEVDATIQRYERHNLHWRSTEPSSREYSEVRFAVPGAIDERFGSERYED